MTDGLTELTVAELIERLRTLPPEAKVWGEQDAGVGPIAAVELDQNYDPPLVIIYF